MKIPGHEILRQSIFVALLIGILAGAWCFVFRPRNQQDEMMRRQIEAKQKQLRKLNQATATIGSLKDEIGDLQKAIDFFQSKLPSEKEIDRVLEEVWRLAEANHLATKSICTMKSGSSGTFVLAGGAQAEQPIKMKFEGDFTGFYGFLLSLERQPRIMRIRKMSLKKISGTQGGITAELEISVFFERQSSKDKRGKWSKKA